jgi:gas vesicle protein
MNNKHILATAILSFSLGMISCTHQDQKELSNDVKAAGEAAKQTASDAADATKKAAASTDLGDKTKKVAGDVEKGAKNAYDAAADATQKAVDKTKEAAQKAADKTKKDLK